METVSDEARTLHRTMRDVVALSALPAVWAGYQPRQVAEGLADALLSTLRLDLVYLRLPRQTEGQEIEVARSAGRPTTTDETRNLGRALAPCLDGGTADSAPAIPNPAGGGTVRLAVVRIGGDREGGVLVAGSQRTGFPSEADRLLLTVGANQAAAVLQRQRAEGALRESEERFRTLAKATNDAVWDWDLGTNKVWWSEGVFKLFGYVLEQNEADPAWWLERIHPDDREAVEAFFFEVVRGKELSWVDEYRFRCADGSYKDVYDRGYVLRDADGRAVRMIGAMLDITARKRAEEALRASERRFRVFVDHAADAFLLQDEQARILDVNRQACESLGYTRDELVGTTPFDFDPVVTPADLEDMRRKLLAGETFVFESRHRRKDGTIFPVEIRGQVFWEGDRWFVVSLARDMTERKRAEELLRESEHRWRGLAEALPQLVWTATADGACDYFSTQWTQHTGVPEGGLLGWRWLDVLHPDDREPTRRLWTASVEGRGPYDVEYRVRRFDGEYRWFKTRGVPIRDSEGGIFKWFGTCTDITTGKQLEEELRRANERLDLAVRGSNIAIWENDMPDGDPRHGRPYQLNYWEQLGYERPDLPPDYETGRASIDPDDLAPVEEAIRSYLAGETSKFEVEFRVRHKDGSYRWMLTRGVAVRDAAGTPIRFAGSAVDITDRKVLEVELRRAKEAAEAANRAKDEFLANVSHEIRTPFGAILGMTELALDTPLTDDQRQYLKTVKSAADNLLGIINDLLDFSKIEAGKLELDPAGFSLRAALGDTLRALAVRAHRKGLELIYHVQPDVPDGLVGDAGRLRQVLLNLVGNAIKFTEEGEVMVRVEVASGPAPEGEVGLRFAVRDTGIGIPHDKQGKIFRAFEQEDSSTTRRYGGTGLGLSIAARLVALMGGSITVQSELGRGSTFAFTAKFGRQPHPTEKTPALPPVLLRGLRVLVVDDNATNRHILEEWLRDWQMSPTAVGDGVAAMDVLWDAASVGRPYPLVLLDARMPDTDGLALAARIRERAALSAIRIILLTSGDRPGNPARSRELRIDAHLLKPVQQDELLETIYRVMSRTNGPTPAAAPPVPAEQHAQRLSTADAPLRILVAEDNEFNTRHLEQLLATRGHAMQLASNGREALVLLGIDGEGSGGSPLRAPGPNSLTPTYDLMLLDLHMPELDGFEVVRAIRERERAAGGHLPVIALTARSRKEDRERCLAAGMDDYLAKPLRAADLFAAIDRMVSAHRDPQLAKPAVGDGTKLLDPVVLLAVCGADPEALRARCQDLRTYLPGRLAEMGDALRAGDAPQLREAAHKLCGLLSVFSTSAASVASDLEDRAADGRLDESAPLVVRLEALAGELLQQIDGLSIETLCHQAGSAEQC
jgi:two-component system, sensor histidine kinase and response regulator